MNIEIDITMKFLCDENNVFVATDEDGCILIEEGMQKEDILSLVFPEFKDSEGWDSAFIIKGNVVIREGWREKKGPAYLYPDGSILYVLDDDGEVYIRYIGNSSEMCYRLDNLKFVVPTSKSWFTNLMSAQPANI